MNSISKNEQKENLNKNNNNKGKSNLIKNIICIIFLIMMLPVLVVSGTIVVKSMIIPEVPGDFMGYMPLVIKSSENDTGISAFNNNSVIVFKKINKETELEVDEIVCYWQEDEIHTKILKEIDTENNKIEYTVGNPGDTLNDKKISQDEIIGEYTYHVNGLGSIVSFAGTPLGMICLIGIPTALFYLLFI